MADRAPEAHRTTVRPLAAVLLATIATSPGQTYLVSAFNEPLREALDIDAATLAGAYMAGTLVSASLLTWVGRVADRVGPRRVMMAAAVGMILAGLAMSQVGGVVALGVGFFLLRFTGQGSLSLACAHALALRYERKLATFEGLRAGALALAVAVTPGLGVLAIDALGWRTAVFLVPAAGALLALFAAGVLLDPDPAPRRESASDAAADFDLKGAMRRRAYWTLAACIVLGATFVTAIHFHMTPIMAEAGYGRAAAAATFGSYATASLIANLAGGPLADRFAPRYLLALATTGLGVGCALLGFADSLVEAHVAVAVCGGSHGLGGVVSGPALARFFGRAHHGAIRGSVGTIAVAGTAAGPLFLGLFERTEGGFGLGLIVLGVLCIPVALASATLRPPVNTPK